MLAVTHDPVEWAAAHGTRIPLWINHFRDLPFRLAFGDLLHIGLNLAGSMLVQEGGKTLMGALAPEDVEMSAAPVAVMDAHCPLCGAPILLVGRSGRVLAEDFHAVPLHKHGRGGGFLVCDDCALLAELPADTTLN